jgi:hypothetical protein
MSIIRVGAGQAQGPRPAPQRPLSLQNASGTLRCLCGLAGAFEIFFAWGIEGVKDEAAVGTSDGTMGDATGDGVGIAGLEGALIACYVEDQCTLEDVAKLFVWVIVVGHNSSLFQLNEGEHDATARDKAGADAFQECDGVDGVQAVKSWLEGCVDVCVHDWSSLDEWWELRLQRHCSTGEL